MNKKIRAGALVLALAAALSAASFATVLAVRGEAETAAAAAVEEAAVLRQGSRGEDVKTVQRKLKRWGYYDGNVDGIYDSDPALNPSAKKYDRLTFSDIVNKGLKAMDATAATMCMENDIPVLAFALGEEDSILRAVCGESLGTLISNE